LQFYKFKIRLVTGPDFFNIYVFDNNLNLLKMRFIAILVFCAVCGVLRSQTYDHKLLLNLNGGFSTSAADLQQVGGSLRIGSHNGKKLAFGVDLGYLNATFYRSTIEQISAQPFLRIYPGGLGNSGVFLSGQAGYASVFESIENANGKKQNRSADAFVIGPGLGMNSFLTEQIALEFLISAQRAISASNGFNSSWGLDLGFGILIFL